MDLLSIGRILWRHKLLVIPVIVLTLCGAAYVALFSKPLYETTRDYVFVPPPTAPTSAQIAQDPSLAQSTDNVFTRFYDQSIIADSLISRLSSATIQQALVDQGADSRYTVSPITLYGSSQPMVELMGTGSTPAKASTTVELVSRSLVHNLYVLQSQQGTAPGYMFTALEVASSPPLLKVSSLLRSLVAVLGVGVVLLFVVVSVGDAIDKKRAEARLGRRPPVAVEGNAPSGVVVRKSELHLWSPIHPPALSDELQSRPVKLQE
jgi:capsular polysaccharide biosynthesis protein